VYVEPVGNEKGPKKAGRSMPMPELFKSLEMLTPGPVITNFGFV
jgi:hypothetical protein